MRTYTFHVSLPGTGRVWRKIEMRANQTLEKLHYAIQEAYGWNADHLYSFFMSNRAWDISSEYTLPEISLEEADAGEEKEEETSSPTTIAELLRAAIGDKDISLEELKAKLGPVLGKALEGPGDVRRTTIEELGLRVGHEFMYLFDYGDDHRFRVRVHAINPKAPRGKYPRIVQSVGKAPEQYPSYDD